MIKTDDIILEKDLRELFSMEEDDGELKEEEWTHDGCWKREENEWRFWKHENLN